jgi:CBS domain-containing protein
LYVYYNDGNSSQWVQPQTPTVGAGGAGGGATAITELTDVSISNLSSGQVLKYNGTVWINGEDNTGGGGGGGATLLDQLTDVVLSSPATDQILKYNGTTWINASLPTLVTSITAGTGISVTASTGNITITNTVSTPALSSLPDAALASLRVDRIAYQAITRLVVSNTGATAFNFSQYVGNNPVVYVINGTTIAFELTSAGHPFLIQDPLGNNYSTGLIHVATDGTTSTGASAQGKTSGTLYWQVPRSISGSYRYQSSTTGSLVGLITVKDFAAI